MEAQKTLCPNCGANITNHQNCEFCGSLLIRLVDKGMSIEQSGFGKDAQVFPGMIQVLESFVAGLNKDSLCTISDKFSYGVLQVAHNSVVADALPSGMAIAVNLITNNEKNRLEKMGIFPLFTEIEGDMYLIDFGLDCEGAAKFITRLLIEFFGVDPDTTLLYEESGDCSNYQEKYYIGGKDEPFRSITKSEYTASEYTQNKVEEDYSEEKPWYEQPWVYVISVGLYILFRYIL